MSLFYLLGGDNADWRADDGRFETFRISPNCRSHLVSLVFLCGRYRIEYEALSKVESEQNEFIDQFILQKWGCDQDSRKCTTSATTFPECLSCSLWALMPPSESYCAATLFLKQFQSSNIIKAKTSTSSVRHAHVCVCVCVCVCVKQHPAAYCRCSHPGQISSGDHLQCCKLEYIWNVRFRSHQTSPHQHLRPTWNMTELIYTKKQILFILFILKNYSVYLVLLRFVSIEILHVHASVNTVWS